MATTHTVRQITRRVFALPTAMISVIAGLLGCSEPRPSSEMLAQIYAEPAAVPEKSLKVYHLGHSLVGRTMPAMLAQLAGSEHQYHSQLGWGTTLQAHWEPDVAINGFETENAHDHYRDVFEAIDGQSYDAFILTEMVEIQDAIRYFDSAKYFTKFAQKIAQTNPTAKIYLYESWHEVTDDYGWKNRLARDYDRFWLGEILDKALTRLDGKAIYSIPVGQAMKRFFDEVELRGGIDGIDGPEAIFARAEDGSLDPIHINDIGSYFVALVHYAVLYQKSPEGLPYQLHTADGTPASSPSPEAAALMQEIIWETVSADYRTGLRAYPGV